LQFFLHILFFPILYSKYRYSIQYLQMKNHNKLKIKNVDYVHRKKASYEVDAVKKNLQDWLYCDKPIRKFNFISMYCFDPLFFRFYYFFIFTTIVLPTNVNLIMIFFLFYWYYINSFVVGFYCF
jgi:hypothetical protein